MSRKPMMLALVLPLLMSSACARNTTATAPATVTTEFVPVSDYCLVAKGITFSEAHAGDIEDRGNAFDTPETVAQVKDADRVFERLCPSPPTIPTPTKETK